MSKAPLRTHIDFDGQSYLDEPVYAQPMPLDPLDQAIRAAFNSHTPKPILLGYERVRLRWMTRTKDGRSVPR